MNRTLPVWLKQKLPRPSEVNKMNSLLTDLQLNTVCQSAACPNLGECFSNRTATFLILGDICTRNCLFCAVEKGHPSAVDSSEPQRISEAVKRLELAYVVITSVTRDDLPDGGAGHFANTLRAIYSHNSGVTTEVLIPDFQGSTAALSRVMQAHADVVSHNIETVPRLYPAIRPGADYGRSLILLKTAKAVQSDTLTKSGIMLGLGERYEEVINVMEDIRKTGCDILTVGQYLSPSSRNASLERYITPEEFEDYARTARQIGFKAVVSGPWVRSSYHAAGMYREAIAIS
ncbi:MAG: lipoyl synthase [Chloroflexi bacterium RBG_16_50_9]|nr:MAG: lipoyl synthase [Chloroflexi bacterium RBG_16_50_9]